MLIRVLKLAFALTPFDSVDAVFQTILESKPEIPRIDDFEDYFVNTYFDFLYNYRTILIIGRTMDQKPLRRVQFKSSRKL